MKNPFKKTTETIEWPTSPYEVVGFELGSIMETKKHAITPLGHTRSLQETPLAEIFERFLCKHIHPDVFSKMPTPTIEGPTTGMNSINSSSSNYSTITIKFSSNGESYFRCNMSGFPGCCAILTLSGFVYSSGLFYTNKKETALLYTSFFKAMFDLVWYCNYQSVIVTDTDSSSLYQHVLKDLMMHLYRKQNIRSGNVVHTLLRDTTSSIDSSIHV